MHHESSLNDDALASGHNSRARTHLGARNRSCDSGFAVPPPRFCFLKTSLPVLFSPFAAHAGLVWGALGYLNEACHVLAPLPCNGVEWKPLVGQGRSRMSRGRDN
jgi:hypothetical protein